MANLNSKNYNRLIDDYSQAARQEYRKSDILLENFDIYLENGGVGNLESKSEGSSSTFLVELEKERTLLALE